MGWCRGWRGGKSRRVRRCTAGTRVAILSAVLGHGRRRWFVVRCEQMWRSEGHAVRDTRVEQPLFEWRVVSALWRIVVIPPEPPEPPELDDPIRRQEQTRQIDAGAPMGRARRPAAFEANALERARRRFRDGFPKDCRFDLVRASKQAAPAHRLGQGGWPQRRRHEPRRSTTATASHNDAAVTVNVAIFFLLLAAFFSS